MFHHRALIEICAEHERQASARSRGFASRLVVSRCHRRATAGRLAAGVIVLLLTGFESTSYGGGPLPPTPCPCAADGICRPNRVQWGYSQTRWRSWPGEQAGQSPTPVAGPTAEDTGDQALQPFEAPLPEDEDLRGPAKGRIDESAKSETDEVPVEEPGVLLPSPEALPLFDPQGNKPQQPNQFIAPPGEDAPPVLPESLRHAARSLQMPRLSRHQQPAASPATIAPQSTPGPIRPVSWQQPAIHLINPASAVVTSEANTLQQAIYYEASDLDHALEK